MRGRNASLEAQAQEGGSKVEALEARVKDAEKALTEAKVQWSVDRRLLEGKLQQVQLRACRVCCMLL